MTLKWNKEPYGKHEYVIEFTDHKYSGIKFVLGKVELVEEKDQCTLKYKYDIIENNTDMSIVDEEKTEFEKAIGDLVVEMIGQGLLNNELDYYGGKNENRKFNHK
jgi:hypothetical protein